MEERAEYRVDKPRKRAWRIVAAAVALALVYVWVLVIVGGMIL